MSCSREAAIFLDREAVTPPRATRSLGAFAPGAAREGPSGARSLPDTPLEQGSRSPASGVTWAATLSRHRTRWAKPGCQPDPHASHNARTRADQSVLAVEALHRPYIPSGGLTTPRGASGTTWRSQSPSRPSRSRERRCPHGCRGDLQHARTDPLELEVGPPKEVYLGPEMALRYRSMTRTLGRVTIGARLATHRRPPPAGR